MALIFSSRNFDKIKTKESVYFFPLMSLLRKEIIFTKWNFLDEVCIF